MKSPKTEHMAQRQAAGLSYRKLAGEFGVSKSTAHRALKDKTDGFSKPVKKPKGFSLKDGFTKMGSAK
jgi:transcriptional regulator with XRE-family HTH domain